MADLDATVALGAGTALALGAALVVLGPLWSGATDLERTPRGPEHDDGPTGRAEGVSPVEALREIEFDRATGKLADDDYAALKAAYTRDALAELRAASGRESPAVGVAAGGPPADGAATADPVEAALRAYRARQSSLRGDGRTCVVDGPRPEADALFCSVCGRFLAGHCPQCGAACDQPAQRFCSTCGTNLAAGASVAAAVGG